MSAASSLGRIAVVDDAPILRRIVTALLDKTYTVSAFASGQEFLASPLSFDLLLLDIEMPEMDGYEVCRRLRGRSEGGDIPVIFVSSHDTPPERIEAYKAGGNDFIVKPVAADELRHKVAAILDQQVALKDLASRSQAASEIAFVAMTTAGELGVILDFMRRSAACTDQHAVGLALLDTLSAFGLSGAVQVRSHAGKLNLTLPGQASPLQDSVMDALCAMDRIFVFGSRGIVNYPHVSLLVLNLPTDDEIGLGRIRDHLALLAEGAEARLAAIAASRTVVTLHGEAGNTLGELRATLAQKNARLIEARHSAQERTLASLATLARISETFSISDIQRETIRHTLHDTVDDLRELFDEAAGAESDFTHIITMLERMMQERGQ